MSRTKKLKAKTFQFFKMQTRRLVASFDGLSSSLAQSAGELQSCKVMVNKWLTQVVKVKPTRK